MDERLFINGKPVRCKECNEWIDLGNIHTDLERIETCAPCVENLDEIPHTYSHEWGCCDDSEICVRCDECKTHYRNCSQKDLD